MENNERRGAMKTIPSNQTFKLESGSIIISKPKSCLLSILPAGDTVTVQNYMSRVERGYLWDKRYASTEDKRLIDWLEKIYVYNATHK